MEMAASDDDGHRQLMEFLDKNPAAKAAFTNITTKLKDENDELKDENDELKGAFLLLRLVKYALWEAERAQMRLQTSAHAGGPCGMSMLSSTAFLQ
jgi:hypothetical protein